MIGGRRLLGLVVCGILLAMAASGSVAQEATPDATPGSTCTVSPRSEEEIAALSDLAATPAAVPAVTPPGHFSEGEVVDAATLAEIKAVLLQLRACEAAGDLPRLLALYTDAFVVREVLAGEPVPILPGTPRPEAGGEEIELPTPTFEADELVEARMLPDGRVAALVGNEDAGDLIVFAQEDGLWRIDFVAVYATLESTAVASPSGEVSPDLLQLPAVQAALADAVARLGAPMTELTVESVERVVWPDASLGCPQEGQFYAQVETPGYRVVVAAGDQRVEYHTDESGIVVVCDGE